MSDLVSKTGRRIGGEAAAWSWRRIGAEALTLARRSAPFERTSIMVTFAGEAGLAPSDLTDVMAKVEILKRQRRMTDLGPTDVVCSKEAVEWLRSLEDLAPLEAATHAAAILAGKTPDTTVRAMTMAVRSSAVAVDGTATASVEAGVAACLKGDSRLRSAAVRTRAMPPHAAWLGVDAEVAMPPLEGERTAVPARSMHAVFMSPTSRAARNHGTKFGDVAQRIVAATAFYDKVHLYAASHAEVATLAAIEAARKGFGAAISATLAVSTSLANGGARGGTSLGLPRGAPPAKAVRLR